jgi:RsmE family RNA methyltransferase
VSRPPHIYVPGPWETADLSVGSDKQRHLEKVLRLSDGAAVTYTDGAGHLGQGQYGGGQIERGDESSEAERTAVTLAVAPPKAGDRQRFVVEKCAELAVGHLVWIDPARGVGKAPNPAKSEAWAASALEQSLGVWRMAISEGSLDDLPEAWLADPAGEPWVRTPQLAIGPEGGWTESEKQGRRLVSFGTGVLRIETAAVVAAAFHHKP